MNLSHQIEGTSQSPQFSDPPVVETALGVQFDELSKMTASHLGLYYSLIRDQFPIAQDQSRLPFITELFPARPALPEFKLQLVNAKPVERVWFTSKTNSGDPGDQLIQLQPDRFGFNWRKSHDGASYPSFSHHQPVWHQEFARFSEFCHQEGLGEVKPNLCEVVYVNHIVPPEGRSAIEDFALIFPDLTWGPGSGWLPAPERVALNRVFVIGENQGRLYAEASIGSTKDKGDIIVLKMVGRVICKDGLNVADSLRLAHDWVVKGFECLTDATVRKERWGQTV